MTDQGELVAGDPAHDDAFLSALLDDDAEELYESAPCAYLSMLPDGTIVKANRTFSNWTGHDREVLVGRRRFQELLAPGDRIFYETHFAPLLMMQGQAREIAVELVTGEGSRLPVLVNSVVSTNPDGSPRLVRTAIFDATERRSYERELLAALRRAEESEARATALAQTLQSTFLPPEIIPVPGVDIGGAYRPAGDGSEVGGDFYDVFETGRGTWGVVIGDVCGKGPSAAVVTALARYTVRAEALRTPYPSAVLAVLHHALLLHHPDHFCTALLATVERGSQPGIRLTLAAAGHQLPIRCRAGGGIDTIGTPGTILGILDTPRLHDSTTHLQPGDVLVLYTDGVTEARHQGEFFDDDRLRETIEAGRHLAAGELADKVVATAIEFQHGHAADDIAVVVLKVPD